MLDELGSVEEIVVKDVVVAVEVDVGMDVAVGVKGTRDVSVSRAAPDVIGLVVDVLLDKDKPGVERHLEQTNGSPPVINNCLSSSVLIPAQL